MTDIATEHDAAIELVIEEYERLKQHNPNHPLLKYLCDVTEGRFSYIKNHYSEFLKKFAPEKNTPTAVMLAQYYVALRDEVDKIEGIDRSPKPQKPNNLDTIMEEEGEIGDLPF